MPQIKQTLLLNKHAILLHSCDSLFATNNLRNKNVIPYFPFLESVFDNLFQQLQLEEVVTFPGVETKHSFLPGYYDYVFRLVEKNKNKLIQWQILDDTDTYKEIKIQQQTNHEERAFPCKKRPNTIC